MHSKVPSSFMLVVMADGLPNLSSKKLVDSHMHFSAGIWIRKALRSFTPGFFYVDFVPGFYIRGE